MRVWLLGAVLMLTVGCAAPADSGRAPTSTSPEAVAPMTISSSDLGAPPAIANGFALDAPKRIVSLATGIGETLVALGATDRVVGRDETSDIPQLVDVPVVTKAHSVSTERVIALNPDLILVDSATGPPEAVDQLRAIGLSVVEVPDAWTPAEIDARIATVAEAIGAMNVQSIQIDQPREPAPNAPRVAFLYLRGPSAIYLLGGQQSGADALVAAAGGIDVGAAAGYDAFIPLTAEALAQADPEVLLVMTKGLASVGGIDGLLALPGVSQTKAALDRRVIAVDDGILLSFGPRTPALVERLREALTPQP